MTALRFICLLYQIEYRAIYFFLKDYYCTIKDYYFFDVIFLILLDVRQLINLYFIDLFRSIFKFSIEPFSCFHFSFLITGFNLTDEGSIIINVAVFLLRTLFTHYFSLIIIDYSASLI